MRLLCTTPPHACIVRRFRVLRASNPLYSPQRSSFFRQTEGSAAESARSPGPSRPQAQFQTLRGRERRLRKPQNIRLHNQRHIPNSLRFQGLFRHRKRHVYICFCPTHCFQLQHEARRIHVRKALPVQYLPAFCKQAAMPSPQAAATSRQQRFRRRPNLPRPCRRSNHPCP